MDLQTLLELFPLGGVLFVWGVTEVAYYIFKYGGAQKMPSWFIFIPVAAGFLFSIFNFLSEFTDEFARLPFYVKFARSMVQGMIGIGAAVVIFEAKKRITKYLISRYFPKKDGQ